MLKKFSRRGILHFGGTCKLIWKLAWHNFINRYRNSYMGFLWTVAYPLTSAGVLWFVFSQAFKVQPPKDGTPFIVWLLGGMVAWNFFADALVCMTGCIGGNAYMLKKRSFDIALLPLIYALSSFFSNCVFLGIVVAIHIGYGVLPSLYWLQLFYYAAYMLVLSLGIGILTSAIAVFVPDVQNMVNIFVQVFFWATPVFWSVSMLPPQYAFWGRLNPAAYMVEGYRAALLGQTVFWDDPGRAVLYWLFALTLLFFAIRCMRRMKPHFADIL